MTTTTRSVDPTVKAIAGNLLREARRLAGMTQAEFAGRIGVTQSVVSEYESGRRQPTLSTVVRLVEAAGLELRFALDARDGHDEVLAQTLGHDPEGQAAWEAEQQRWVRNRKAVLALEDVAAAAFDEADGRT